MVSTKGFRDVIEIRRANKEDLWDTYKDVVPPYVPRRDRLVVSERVDAQGDIVTPLNEEEAREVARILKRRKVAAVAVCFMNAFMNGENERRMKEILMEVMPGVSVSTSSEVLPEIFEHERFSTTVANAALSPVVVDYTSRLGKRLAADGYQRDLLLLHTGGGVMTPKSVRTLPPGSPAPASPPVRSPANILPNSAASKIRSASTWAARQQTSRLPMTASRG
ncbi:hypothetical protein D9M72_278820 [compost metagenome]